MVDLQLCKALFRSMCFLSRGDFFPHTKTIGFEETHKERYQRGLEHEAYIPEELVEDSHLSHIMINGIF